MTNREAIKRLKMILEEVTADEDAVCYVTSDDADALEVAIKALEQEPCDDAISRQAVLKPYQTLKDSDTICIWLLRKNIEQIPSVTPKHKPCISRQTIKDIDRAFKALEERDELLEKIRAEIEKLNPVDYGSIYSYESHYGAKEMQNDVLDIIDKYKESEG
jgi:hypothetical protein